MNQFGWFGSGLIRNQNILSALQNGRYGVDDGEQRVLFYSGHGAQIPAYGVSDEVDHMDECLVPYDFDWRLERAVTDTQFWDLYSQLPYNCYFAAIFDCCYSSGLTRAGGRKIRGITPPDDIRHRALRWNAKLQMWEDRPMAGSRHRITHPAAGRIQHGPAQLETSRPLPPDHL